MGRRPEASRQGAVLANEDFRSLGKPISDHHIGKRVDSYLALHYPFLTRAGWQKRLSLGQVKVLGEAIHSAYKLKEGDVLTHYNPEENEPEINPYIFPFWEENGVMAVYKPSNLPMHEGGKYRKHTFCELLRKDIGEEWAAVHRLDRDTSGLVLCSNDSVLRNQLSMELRERTLEKTYLAIARGVPREDSWVESRPLGIVPHHTWREKRWVVEEGLPSQTEFKVIDTAGEFCLLKVKPKTGRTHQIRIHAAVNDLPLVGDTRYNPDENIFLEFLDHGFTENVIQKIDAPRLCLHATALSFIHPVSEKRCDVAIPMPDDMSFIWRRLKAQASLPIESIDVVHSISFKDRFEFVK